MAEDEGSSPAEKLTFLLIGAGIGATLALLFAPKSGRELRGDIADYTRRGVDAAGESARQVGTRASELYDNASERVQGAYGTARDRAQTAYSTARDRVSQGADAVADIASRQKDQLQAAIEAGKQAYREEKRKAGDVGGAVAEPEV